MRNVKNIILIKLKVELIRRAKKTFIGLELFRIDRITVDWEDIGTAGRASSPLYLTGSPWRIGEIRGKEEGEEEEYGGLKEKKK